MYIYIAKGQAPFYSGRILQSSISNDDIETLVDVIRTMKRGRLCEPFRHGHCCVISSLSCDLSSFFGLENQSSRVRQRNRRRCDDCQWIPYPVGYFQKKMSFLLERKETLNVKVVAIANGILDFHPSSLIGKHKVIFVPFKLPYTICSGAI